MVVTVPEVPSRCMPCKPAAVLARKGAASVGQTSLDHRFEDLARDVDAAMASRRA